MRFLWTLGVLLKRRIHRIDHALTAYAQRGLPPAHEGARFTIWHNGIPTASGLLIACPVCGTRYASRIYADDCAEQHDIEAATNLIRSNN